MIPHSKLHSLHTLYSLTKLMVFESINRTDPFTSVNFQHLAQQIPQIRIDTDAHGVLQEPVQVVDRLELQLPYLGLLPAGHAKNARRDDLLASVDLRQHPALHAHPDRPAEDQLQQHYPQAPHVVRPVRLRSQHLAVHDELFWWALLRRCNVRPNIRGV